MRKKVQLLLVLLFIISIQFVPGQGLYSPGQPEDDGRFAASTKQVNQFFRRFNGEESQDGSKRFYPGDEEYRDRGLRQKFISILFDNETSEIPNEIKNEFLNKVTAENFPQYLNFHGGDWFAEVSSLFTFEGKREQVTLFMKLQPEGLGFEWVIDKVSFDPYISAFNKSEGNDKKFLHPLSHELDNKKPESYTPKNYRPDYLTLFLYEIKKGNIRFETVTDVNFHFFQIDNWYFELSQFNRPGFNTGWLISNMAKVTGEDREVILQYIYDQE
jgi:hypothetical protein